MDDIAVTRYEDQNYQILSCHEIAQFKGDRMALNAQGIKWLVKPLLGEQVTDDFIKKVESTVQTDGLNKLMNEKKEEKSLIFFKDEKGRDYRVLFHKFRPLVFGFLLRPLSDGELKEIEKNSVGKTYFTGDPEAMFIKSDDLH